MKKLKFKFGFERKVSLKQIKATKILIPKPHLRPTRSDFLRSWNWAFKNF